MLNLALALLIIGLFLLTLMDNRRVAPVPIEIDKRDPGNMP
jgi:hypothetical protein